VVNAGKGRVYVGPARPDQGNPEDVWITRRRRPEPGKPYAMLTIVHVWQDGGWREVEPPGVFPPEG
jgi:hypothetical protein